MARELVAYCDVCLETDGTKQTGNLVTISIDGSTPVGLDLCELHDKELVEPVRQLAHDLGVPTDRLLQDEPARQRKPRQRTTEAERVFTCPACDYTAAQLQSLSDHFRSAHGTDPSPSQSQFYFGTVCPLCGMETGNDLGRYHVPQNHPEIKGGAIRLFLAAREAGDPHKIVKKQTDTVRRTLKAGTQKAAK